MGKALILVPLLVVAGACSASAQHDDAAGPAVQRDFQVGAFQGVALEGSMDVVVAVGPQAQVRADGPAAALDRLDIRVENGTLKIGTKHDTMLSWHRSHGRVTVHVTAPPIQRAALGGSGDMRIEQAQAPNFAASVGGSGDMEIAALAAREANFSIAGSGSIRASGTADQINDTIAGAGDAALEGLQVNRAHVSLVGSGDSSIHATGSVDGAIMGSGDIVVRGTTQCSVQKIGSGNIHCAP
jgi:hypothetical protein